MAVRSIAIGTVFGRLTVIGEGEPAFDKHGWKHGRSLVRCKCGAETTVSNAKLRSGWTASCGCIKRKHGKAHSSEYNTWISMKQRCLTPNTHNYANYGGRGITVCERWVNSFVAFIEDMGPRPSNAHSLDRKNNDGNYSKENCRWATRLEQANNTRRNALFTFYGKTMTLAQWAEISHVDRKIVAKRLKHGWPEKKAFWTPVRHKRATSYTG